MYQLLKERLWAFIVQNNPDIMHDLQDEYRVVQYLEEQVSGIMPMALDLLEKDIPGYAIIERCINKMTEPMRPSRFRYLISVLHHDFELEYLSLQENGSLSYVAVELVHVCHDVFETHHFCEEKKADKMLRAEVTALLTDYFIGDGKKHIILS